MPWLLPHVSRAAIEAYEIAKGWAFVGVTGVVLYTALLRFLRRAERAEQAEKTATERYLGILEVTPVAVFVQQEGRLVSVNEHAVRLLGAVERIIGCEALLRWNSPVLGPMSPAVFIPVAEDAGLMDKLGLFALETACRQAKAWHDAGLAKVVVSVNVSGQQLRKPGFPAAVRKALAGCGIDASWIEVELTESILMRDVHGAVEIVQALKALGLRLAIDDFGTGYSNLAELSRFPADRLKIDQSFVQGIERPEAAAIVRTIISLGQALKLEVIAEGVETEVQARTLKAWGCRQFQGYLFGRPMDAEAFTARLRGR